MRVEERDQLHPLMKLLIEQLDGAVLPRCSGESLRQIARIDIPADVRLKTVLVAVYKTARMTKFIVRLLNSSALKYSWASSS